MLNKKETDKEWRAFVKMMVANAAHKLAKDKKKVAKMADVFIKASKEKK